MSIAPTLVLAQTTQETTNYFLALPTPSNILWNEGVEEQVYSQRNAIGDLVFDEAMTTQRQPVITATFPRMTKELIALKLGYKFNNQAVSETAFAFSRRLDKLSFPAAASGFAGHGMLANIAEASVIKDGISEPLTRSTFATWDPDAAPDTFAQGAAGELEFSTNLLNKYVTVFGNYPTTAADVISENPFSIFKLRIFGVLQTQGVREVFYVQFNQAQAIAAENDEFDFSSQDVPVQFRSLDTDCVPQLVFPNRKVLC